MVSSQISPSVVATVAYCDQFEYPLTRAEIETRLIQVRDEEASRSHQPHRLQERDGFYFLAGSERHLATRRQRHLFSTLKWAEAATAIHLLRWIPWVQGIAITGSLAMNNATIDDDIDFMMITQPHRLWLTRLFVITLAWLKGKRRSWHTEEKNSWCFNLWLEETDLHSPGLNQSVYTAYEVCQAKFLINRDRTEQRFIWANQWVAEYLPHYFVARCEAATGTEPHLQWWLTPTRWLDYTFWWVISLVNELAFYVQWLYMWRHRTREVVTRSKAFFHPRDTGKQVAQRWRAALTK